MICHSHRFRGFRRGLVLVGLIFVARLHAQNIADPRITSWQTGRSGSYARAYETASDKASGNAVTTWPRAGLINRGGGVATPTYSDVSRVVYSANSVYIYTTGLASYTMGPWLNPNGALFGMWPINRGAIHRIPRTPTIPTVKQRTNGGGGVLVNGVFLWAGGDGQSYTTSTGIVSPNGQDVWNRLAGPTEGPTFDAGNAHQPGTGEYHNHINPRALRFQLGDAVSYSPETKTFAETAPTKHSPIIGWAVDGLPVYGPYGYSTAMNPASGVRRMTSGFTKRDGTFGTTNLAATGRTTLAVWAASVQGKSAALPPTEYGPSVAVAAMGTFAEDYDYLGDLGKTPGVDFDLNRQNVRFGVTPEFPSGTYAYFTCIDGAGNTIFPDIIGQEFFGAVAAGPNRGTVTAVVEPVTEYVRAGQAAAISVSATNASGTVAITWTSVEGATYRLETSPDAATWTTLAAAVTSNGGDRTTYATATMASNYRVTLVALAAYDIRGSGGVSGMGNNALVALGTSGTARLVNIATRVALGGAAGTPIPGFVLSGTGTKKMLVRAIGPTLASFGVGGVLADPRLSLMSGPTMVVTNDNWLATDAATMADVGAFVLTPGSKDAALVAALTPGAYTAPVTAADGGAGVTLLEVYDATGTGALVVVNASTRGFVGVGDAAMIPGFVIAGTGALRMLIRVVGPTLAVFSVPGALADPTLTLFRGATALAVNDNWSAGAGASEISSTAAAVGAFALPEGSKDAAIVVTLPAGSYTAVVTGVGNTTGTALVELYVAP
ncbi:MAG: hypothetical protein RL077_6413 [Verrucomicrobiota bacterium]